MPHIRWIAQSETPVAARLALIRAAVPPSARAARELRPVVEPPMAPRDETIFLLGLAAEVEHSLLVQYLYAAFSLGGPGVPAEKRNLVAGWRAMVLEIAREEMGHLATVQNLLRLLGGSINLEREDYPFRTDFYPFHFRLEPLSKYSLAKYIVAELPAEIDQAAEIDEILARASDANLDQEPNRVGALYRQIADLLATLSDEDLSPDGAEMGADPGEWTHGLPNLIVRRPVNLGEALEALKAIAEQGEGPTGTASEILAPSHFWRFLDIYRRFPDEEEWRPTRAVPTNPNTDTLSAADPEREAGRITHPRARQWAHLANLRYRRLLANLAHALQTSADASGRDAAAHDTVVRWTFQEMHQISRLAEILIALPRTEANDGATGNAAPPFELPYSLVLPDVEADRWRLQQDILDTSALLVGALLADAPPNEKGALDALRAQDQQDRAAIAEFLVPRVTGIKALRVLPPLVIGRFGSSLDPMDNYEARVVDVTGYRRLEPAPTLRVDPDSGQVSEEFIPDQVRFRDADGKVRPVAPFLEIWAQFEDDGDFEPLTTAHLDALGLAPSDLRWQAIAANLKAARRTGNAGDRVVAETGVFSDYVAHDLVGRADHFKPGKTVTMGSIRYLQPSAKFPEIRARFTPSAGLVYGPDAGDPLTHDDVYDAQRGGWDNHFDGDPAAPINTFPGGTYQGKYDAQTRRYISDGYLDDACDGILTVEIAHGGRVHQASARFCSGVPDFAPDSFHVRTVGDDLDQALLGPTTGDPIERDSVTDIVRRAMETVRLMNTSAMNADQGLGGVATNFTNQAAHEAGEFGRAFEPIFGQGGAPYYPSLRHHEVLLERWRDGVLPLPPDLLRSYDEAGDLRDEGRHKMPALMRGSDTLQLTLTRRQTDRLRRAAAASQAPSTPEQAMTTLIQFFREMAPLHDHIPVDGGRFLAQLFAEPAALLEYLRTAVAKGPLSGTEQNRPLVVPGDPDASAFVRLLQQVDHPMHGPFSRIVPGTGKTGLQIVVEWIQSLG